MEWDVRGGMIRGGTRWDEVGHDPNSIDPTQPNSIQSNSILDSVE